MSACNEKQRKNTPWPKVEGILVLTCIVHKSEEVAAEMQPFLKHNMG